MTNMTLAVPEDLHMIMKKHKEIKWSEIQEKPFGIRQKNWN